MDAEPQPEPQNRGRRAFVLRLLAAIGAILGLGIGVPVAGFGTAPGWRARTAPSLLSNSVAPTLRTQGWTSVGHLDDFEIGVPKRVEPVRRVVDGWVAGDQPIAVYVVRRTASKVVAFDPHCTHLGCPLQFVEGARVFLCPCHGGVFDHAGDVVSGPPPRPMVRYETKVEQGEILIGALEG
jgi:menaquinol-cytochrome c reductase iron-sulfur subunit